LVRLNNQRWLGYSFVAGFFTLVGILIATGLDLPNPGYSQNKAGSKYLNPGVVSPFAVVVDRAKDAVVNISAEKVGRMSRYHSWMPFGDDRQVPSYSLGSGFIFDSKGYVLTNNHVVSGATEITVTLANESKYKAHLIGSDKGTDVAVLKIEADEPLAALDLGNSDSLLVGDWVLAIGNPFPQEHLDRTVTVGVVSGKQRSNLQFGGDATPDYQDYIQTDAAINQGNSGGPLVDIHGQVVGINSAIASPSGGNVGIGFAIPINLVKEILPDLMQSGKVERGWLGVYLQSLNKELAAANGLKSQEGAVLTDVQAQSPAAEAGLKRGDVILNFDGKKVIDATQLRFWVAKAGPGRDVPLQVYRDGKTMNLSVRLKDREMAMATLVRQPQAPLQTDPGKNNFGLTVRTSTKELCDRFDVRYYPGVIVVEVESGSPADRKEIEPGFIISEVNSREVKAVSDFEAALKTAGQKKALSLLVRDLDSQPNYLALGTP